MHFTSHISCLSLSKLNKYNLPTPCHLLVGPPFNIYMNNINFHFSSTLNHIHILATSIHALSCFNPSLFMLSISNLYSKQCPRQASVLTVFLVL